MSEIESKFEGALLRYWAPDEENAKGTWLIEPPGAPNVVIYHDAQHDQWGVSINTEVMQAVEPATHDERGEPYLLVSLNSGDLHDHERVQEGTQ
jgi:hypothetical protein